MDFLQLSRRRIDRTYLCTNPATDTIIHHKCLWTLRNEIGDGLCRAFWHTEAADPAFIQIDLRKVISNRRSIKRTDLYTDAACDTPCLAVLSRCAALCLLNDR